MPEPRVAVVVPVGPSPAHAGWLASCLASIARQTVQPSEVLLVDDMHGLDLTAFDGLRRRGDKVLHPSLPASTESPFIATLFYEGDDGLVRNRARIWRAPWRLGVPGAFNAGVALADGDLMIMLGADDWLQPEAIEFLRNTYEQNDLKDGYYYYSIRYSDTGELQDLPCNCAAVTKGFMRETGGFPPESAVGACDTMLISMLIKKRPDLLVPVTRGLPLYNYRRHQQTDTATRPVEWQGPIGTVRDILTRTWERPAWGRYA